VGVSQIDSAGNVYVAGFTDSPDFPGVDVGSADKSLGGLFEGFVAKLNPGLSTILAATFLGGSDTTAVVGYELAEAIAIDRTGNVYVAGGTGSPDFPGVGAGSADSTLEGGEGFVAKLDRNLSAAKCNGRLATLTGTGGNDLLTGTAGPDVIVGLGGNDTLSGLGGNDTICGGNGNDTLNGGAGADTLVGGNGRDILRGGTGNDQLRGEAGDDALDGGADTDVCDGGPHVIADTFVNCETAVNRPTSPEELGSEDEEEPEVE
jgi:Ca2+-binding RTX toxin-like protein